MLIVPVIVVATLLTAALFVEKKYIVEREITIDKTTQEVFDYVKFLKNQDYYSKWVMTDPNMKKELCGTDGTVGFVYALGNKKARKGAQKITRIAEGDRVGCGIQFIRPLNGLQILL